MDDRQNDEPWADWRSTVALTGIGPSDLAWAMARGQVDYSSNRPGHEGVLMILLGDVKDLIESRVEPPRLRVVREV